MSELLESFGVVVELELRWLSCIAESAGHENLDLRSEVVEGLKEGTRDERREGRRGVTVSLATPNFL